MRSREQLSSKATWVYSRLMPGLWIVGLGLAMLTVLTNVPAQSPQMSPLARLTLVLLGAVGSAIIYHYSRTLAHVWLEGDTLIAEIGGTEVRYPIAQLAGVTETFISNPRVVVLHFRLSSTETAKVRLIPPLQISLPFVQHPVTKRLKALMAARG